MSSPIEMQVQTRVEFRGVELLRDVTQFLAHARDAAGPFDGSAEAAKLLDRFNASIVANEIVATASVDGTTYTPIRINAGGIIEEVD